MIVRGREGGGGEDSILRKLHTKTQRSPGSTGMLLRNDELACIGFKAFKKREEKTGYFKLSTR